MDLIWAAWCSEQLRKAARVARRPEGCLTVSIGLAEYAPDHDDIATLLARAEKAMRHAISSGRDPVVTAAHG